MKCSRDTTKSGIIKAVVRDVEGEETEQKAEVVGCTLWRWETRVSRPANSTVTVTESTNVAQMAGRECHKPQGNQNSTCQARLNVALASLVTMPTEPVFLPRCHLNGTYQKIQCFDSVGMCWCADDEGNRIKGTMVRGTPNCNEKTKRVRDPPICPSGQVLHRCSPALCYEQTCLAHPTAVCRINPCGNCTQDFYDKDNNAVECLEGVSQCAKHEALAKTVKTGHVMKHLDVMHEIKMDQNTMALMDDVTGHSHGAKQQNLTIGGLMIEPPRFVKRILSSFNKKINGTCPPAEALTDGGACIEACQEDWDCGVGYMCCKSSCGHMCTQPIKYDEVCLLMPPEDNKNCDQFSKKTRIWYYSQETYKCESKKITQCGGKDPFWRKMWTRWTNPADKTENRFTNLLECEGLCQEVYPFTQMFVPECVAPSSDDNSPAKRVYKATQCHRGMCWCMDPDGTVVDGSLTKGPVKCNPNGDVMWSLNPQAVCANGKEPQICHESCLAKDCDWNEAPGDLFQKGWVSCQADPCNDCEVKFVRKHMFYNPEGTTVECQGGETKRCSLPKETGDKSCDEASPSTRYYFNKKSKICLPFTFDGCNGNDNNFQNAYDCHEACGTGPLCVGTPKPLWLLDSICNSSRCDKFPGALCIPDICTGQARFFDITNKQEVNCKDDQGLCHRMQAHGMKLNAMGDEDAHVYECNPDGSFRPTQCNEDRTNCWCVNDNGEELPGTKHSTNQDIKHECEKQFTKAVFVSFAIDEDLAKLNGKISEFLKEWKTEISYTLDMDEEFIVNLQLEYVDNLITVSFEVIPDGIVNLADRLDYLKYKISKEDFYIVFEDYEYWALADEIYVEQLRDPLLDLHPEHASQRSVGHVTGVAVGAVFAGLIVIVAVVAMIFVYRRIRANSNSDGMQTVFGTSPFSNNGFEQFDNRPRPADVPVDTTDVTLDTPTSNSEA